MRHGNINIVLSTLIVEIRSKNTFYGIIIDAFKYNMDDVVDEISSCVS